MKKSYSKIDPIIDISFSIKDQLKDCYSSLSNRAFIYVEGDIQMKGGNKYVALGYKRGVDKAPITDIIGVIQEKNKGENILYEDGIEYINITDEKNNRDIHNGSGGNYLAFYYTRDKSKGRPIKELIFANYREKISSNLEVVQNSSFSKYKGNLNINGGRNPNNFNYIIIIR